MATVTVDLATLGLLVVAAVAIPVLLIYLLVASRLEDRFDDLSESLGAWRTDLSRRMAAIEHGLQAGGPGATTAPSSRERSGVEIVDREGERIGWLDLASFVGGEGPLRAQVEPILRPFLALRESTLAVPEHWIEEVRSDHIILDRTIVDLKKDLEEQRAAA